MPELISALYGSQPVGDSLPRWASVGKGGHHSTVSGYS